MNTNLRVKHANKAIYNKLADRYEAVDGRRSEALSFWIRKRLKHACGKDCRKSILLDLGCGAGFVSKAVKGMYDEMCGVDISEEILKSLTPYKISPICADIEKLPFMNKSIDAVAVFSVMHHLYDYKTVFNEIQRILKPNGIIYIDHDMDSAFYRKFRFFISIYRYFFRKKNTKEKIETKVYNLSEFHSNGVDMGKFREYLVSLNFSIEENFYHWYGLSRVTDIIFKEKIFRRGQAPLGCIVARKK